MSYSLLNASEFAFCHDVQGCYTSSTDSSDILVSWSIFSITGEDRLDSYQRMAGALYTCITDNCTVNSTICNSYPKPTSNYRTDITNNKMTICYTTERQSPDFYNSHLWNCYTFSPVDSSHFCTQSILFMYASFNNNTGKVFNTTEYYKTLYLLAAQCVNDSAITNRTGCPVFPRIITTTRPTSTMSSIHLVNKISSIVYSIASALLLVIC